MRAVTLLVLGLGLLGSVRADVDQSDGGDRPGTELLTAKVQALDAEVLAPGQQGELSLLLLEAPDRELPLAVRIEDSALDPVENRLGWSSVVDPLALQPRLRATFTAPAEPGRYEVRASVDYSVCDERWCRKKRAELVWIVVVELTSSAP